VHNIHAHVLLHNERSTTICCKFPQLHSYQILLKLVNIWLSYSENKKGELFFETQCIYVAMHCFLKEMLMFMLHSSQHFLTKDEINGIIII